MGSRSIRFLLLSFLAGMLALAIDLLILKKGLLAEGPPEFTPLFLLRTALMAACAALFVTSVLHWRELAGPSADADEEAALPYPRVALWTVLSASVLFTFLFVRDPALFYWIAEEDRPIETLSVALCLSAAALFARVAWSVGQTHRAGRSTLRLGAAVLAAAFFLIAMEELSWGQRLLDYDSPQVFDKNRQGEVNLHNFWTDEIENLYYFALFVLLVVVPFVDGETSLVRRHRLASFFVPSRAVAYASMMAFAYNYDMWNALATQLCFFVPLFILVHDLWRPERRAVGIGRGTLLCLGAAYVLTQLLFLVAGGRMVRVWDVTEYKEFLLPLSALIFALELLHRARSRTSPAAPGQ